MLTQREEIDRTFTQAAGSRETLSVDQLVTFLQHQQREEAAGPALALSLIERYEPSETGEILAEAFGLQSLGPHWTGRPLGRLQPKCRELEGRGGTLVSVCLPHESKQMGDRAPASLPLSWFLFQGVLWTPPPGNREEAEKANPFPASILSQALRWTARALSWRRFGLEAQRRRRCGSGFRGPHIVGGRGEDRAPTVG